MESPIRSLFSNFIFIQHEGRSTPVLLGQVPSVILKELHEFTAVCRGFKDHELGFLRNHVNGGTKGFGSEAGNSFQASVPANLVESSFLFPFLNHLGEFYISQTAKVAIEELNRRVQLRRHPGHFDGYDLWINFAYEGDENPEHNHGGSLSGVIYIDDPEQSPTHFENGMSYQGSPGDIVMFPAGYKHSVPMKTSDEERITFAYNLDWKVLKNS